MAEKPNRSLKHSLTSGLVVLVILWFSRPFWSGQGFGYLIGAALAAGIAGEFVATMLLRLAGKSKTPKE
jgi:hypothetical protein